MKKIAAFLCSMALCSQVMGVSFSELLSDINALTEQEPVFENCPLIADTAPSFTAPAVVNGDIVYDFSLKNLRGKYVVLVFYPLDFTFVCPTELHAFQDQLHQFKERNAEVIGCSVDSVYTHLAWLNTPIELGGIQGVTYPLVSDITKSIAFDYEVLHECEGIAYRGLFIIDPKGIIRHMQINDLSVGRNVDEVLRLLDAFISYERNGEVCPANWQKGKKTMKQTPDGLIDYFNKN